MPQLCVSASAAKADTREHQQSQQFPTGMVDPRAEARPCWDQGSIHTSKINEGFGFSHQVVPRVHVQHMPGTMLAVSLRNGVVSASQSPANSLPGHHPTFPLLLLPNGMAPPDANGKKTQPWTATQVTFWAQNLSEGRGLGNTEQNQDKSRAERPKQNMRQDRRSMEPKSSWTGGYKVCWKQSHSEIILGFKCKSAVMSSRQWVQLVFCDILDSSVLAAKPDWRNPQGKSIKQSNLRWQMENEKRGLYLSELCLHRKIAVGLNTKD